jgi:hypothetical protein
MRIKLTLFRLVAGLVASVSICVALPGQDTALAANKISATPASFTLAEGASRVVSVQLDEPIICPGGAAGCEVSIPWVASDPARLSFSPATVHYDYTEWAQVKTFTVTAVDDGTYNASNYVTANATAVSPSEYYNQYHVSLAVTIVDDDPAPTPTPTPAATPTPTATPVAKANTATTTPTPAPVASPTPTAADSPTPVPTAAAPAAHSVPLPEQARVAGWSGAVWGVGLGLAGLVIGGGAWWWVRRRTLRRRAGTRP